MQLLLKLFIFCIIQQRRYFKKVIIYITSYFSQILTNTSYIVIK